MSFLNKIKSSVYDPVFYADVVEGRENGPFKYYLKLSLSLALVFSVASLFMVVPRMKEFLVSAKSKIELSYPKELEVKIKGGVASTNAIEPFVVAIPADIKVVGEEVRRFDNILVIDTKNDFNLERFNSYNTVVLLTKDSFIVEGDNDKLSITPLKSVPDFTVNNENVTKVLGRTDSISKGLSVAVPVLSFVGVFLAYMFKLVYLLLPALLVLILLRIKKLNLNFKKAYSVSMYAVTLPTLLGALFFLFGIQMPFLIPTLMLLIVVWVNLKSSTAVETPVL